MKDKAKLVLADPRAITVETIARCTARWPGRSRRLAEFTRWRPTLSSKNAITPLIATSQYERATGYTLMNSRSRRYGS